MKTTILKAQTAESGAPVRVWLGQTFAKPDDEAAARREVAGLFAPYEVEIERWSWSTGTSRFRIEADALSVLEDAKVFYGHDWQVEGLPIGQVSESTADEEGLWGVAKLSKTTKADEVYELTLDGTLDRFSVGFTVLEYRVEDADTDSACLVITSGEVFEVSIVPFPAFDDARVKSVNSNTHPRKESHMDPENVFSADDGRALTEAVENLSRQVTTLGSSIDAGTPSAPPFASYGEYVKAMLNRDHERHDEAKQFAQTLAYGDGDGDGLVADTTWKDTWVGDIIRLIEQPRKVWNLFDSSPLPAEGMTLEYGKLTANTIDVAEQLAEGTGIVMGTIEVGTDFAEVLTFAGGSKQSFQQAQRSNVNVLDLKWRALAIAYGKTTEQYLRLLLDDEDEVNPHHIGQLGDLEGDADAWTDWLIDVAIYFDDKGLNPEYLRITPDVFKDLAKLRQGPDGPYVLNRSTGQINISGLSGDVSGLPVKLVPGTGLLEVGHSSAIRTFESSGAPARLGPQEDITTLTSAIGVYGFDAVAVQDEKAIVRCPIEAVEPEPDPEP